VRAVDPESYAEAGHGKNLPRLVRALEIFRATGETASALRKRHAFAQKRYDVDVTILSPERAALNARIDARVHDMLARGWVDEVRRLRATVPLDARPMQAVGYREIAAALEKGTPVDAADIAQKTRQYARRQRSFFKHESGRVIEGFG
jgi:tRNA dimethylallyltransferase